MNQTELTWLGQAGFAIAAAGLQILIDPFMSEHESRLYPPPHDVDAIAESVDWLLVTHEHLDHLDTVFLPTLVQRSPRVRLVLPSPLASYVDGVVAAERVTTVQPGDSVTLGTGVVVEVVPAYHGVSVDDGYGDGSALDEGARFVGYVVRTPAISLYHSGDTIVTDDLLDALEGRQVDVALLPINGRDYFREQAGLVGNMNFREAVYVTQRIGAKVLVPMHWDLFAGNTERPGAVLDEIVSIGATFHMLTLARLVPFRFCG